MAMKVRKVVFADFRSFRGLREVSFLDEYTNEPRAMNVLVGSNGTGKTTVLDTIGWAAENLSAKTSGETTIGEMVSPVPKRGDGTSRFHYRHDPVPGLVSVEVAPPEGGESQILTLTPGDPGRTTEFFRGPSGSHPVVNELLGQLAGNMYLDSMNDAIHGMVTGKTELRGGVLYFPHFRNWAAGEGGQIRAPAEKRQWFFRLSSPSSPGWEGSLEQFWVWQNYLDLEAGREGRQNLAPFVSTLEDILGPDRKIIVHKGRVLVPPGWAAESKADELVRIDQLPSGERQMLLLFGELARRLRKGAVVMIDEPEISLHQSLQQLLVHKLRQLARDWDLQIILATHSPEIVNAVSPSEVVFLDQLSGVGWERRKDAQEAPQKA